MFKSVKMLAREVMCFRDALSDYQALITDIANKLEQISASNLEYQSAATSFINKLSKLTEDVINNTR